MPLLVKIHILIRLQSYFRFLPPQTRKKDQVPQILLLSNLRDNKLASHDEVV